MSRRIETDMLQETLLKTYIKMAEDSCMKRDGVVISSERWLNDFDGCFFQ